MRKCDFAQRVGVSAGRVSQWITLGLPVESDGSVDLQRGLAWVSANDRSGGGWPARRAAARAEPAESAPLPAPLPAPRLVPLPTPRLVPQRHPDEDGRSEPNLPHLMLKARTKKLIADACRAERLDRQAAGELIPIAEIRTEYESRVRNARSKLLSLSRRLAPRVAIENDVARCEAIIAEVVAEAMADLAAPVLAPAGGD